MCGAWCKLISQALKEKTKMSYNVIKKSQIAKFQAEEVISSSACVAAVNESH